MVYEEFMLLIYKKRIILLWSDFFWTSGTQSGNKRNRNDKHILGSFQAVEKTVESEGNRDTN